LRAAKAGASWAGNAVNEAEMIGGMPKPARREGAVRTPGRARPLWRDQQIFDIDQNLRLP
jgi:hypothetical protein